MTPSFRRLGQAAAGCLLATLSFASQAIVVTSGFATVGYNTTNSFNLTTDVGSVRGSIPGPEIWGSWPILDWYQAGDAMNVGGFQSGNDLSGGIFTINGVETSLRLDDLFAAYGSSLQFTGAPIVVDNGAGIYRGSFTFDGSFCGTDPVLAPSVNGVLPCVIQWSGVTGHGHVFLEVVDIPGYPFPVYGVRSATYVFVPEPGTLALFTVAILGFAGALSRRRRTRPSSVQ